MYICSFLKLSDNLNRFDIIFDICFAIHFIYMDQFLFLQVQVMKIEI